MKEQELAIISAAVYAYLNSETTEELKNVETEKHDVLKSFSPLVSSLKRKRNSWKRSFFPQVNEKGLRCVRWSR